MLTFTELYRTRDKEYSELPPVEQKRIRKDTTKELCSLFNITKQLLLCKMYGLDPQVLL